MVLLLTGRGSHPLGLFSSLVATIPVNHYPKRKMVYFSYSKSTSAENRRFSGGWWFLFGYKTTTIRCFTDALMVAVHIFLISVPSIPVILSEE